MPPLISVTIVVFLEIVCLGAVIPSLSPFTTKLGGTAFTAGVFFALVSGPKILFNPLWGRLSDRVGRKPILLWLNVFTLLGSALWALSTTLGEYVGSALIWLGISRLVYGVFSAQATLTFSVASDISSPQKRAATMGVLGAAFGLGLTIGFPVGGILSEHSFEAIGWLCVGCEIISLIVIQFALRETHIEREHQEESISLFRFAMRPTMLALSIVAILLTIGYSVMTPTLSLYVEDLYTFSRRETGYAFMVFGIAGVIVQGGLIRPTVRAIGERATFVVGSIILGGGLLMLATEPGRGAFWVAPGLIGIGAGFATPALTAMFSLAASQHEQGTAHGLSQSCTAIGRTACYPTAGKLYESGIALPYWMGGVMALAAMLPLITRAIRSIGSKPQPPSDQA